jgi:biopolymer transport protein ExbD
MRTKSDGSPTGKRIRALLAPDGDPEVYISVDKFGKYEKVAETLAGLQSRGLKKIGFINYDLF